VRVRPELFAEIDCWALRICAKVAESLASSAVRVNDHTRAVCGFFVGT
jgi:hypothetical protein